MPPGGQSDSSPCEFFLPVTGIGSNSSSVPASALACWGSRSEIRSEESAQRETKGVGPTKKENQTIIALRGRNKSCGQPPFGCVESPDSRLKSSRTEAAEVGAEESEEEALPAAGAADGAEMREQPSRESSAVRGSERKQWQVSTLDTGTRNCVSTTSKSGRKHD